MKTINSKITSALKFSMIILMLALTACSGSKEKAAEESHEEAEETEVKEVTLTKEQFDNSEIKIGQIESKNLNGILKVNGKLDVPPQNLVSISMPLGGYLKSTKLLPGMPIKK